MNRITTSELLSKGFVVNNGKWSYKGKTIILDFYADWCQPCKPQETILKELSKEYGEIEFYKVNVEEEYELAELFSIKSLPTVIICGKETKKFVGFTTAQKLETAIKNYLEVLA
ncbi:MAG: thioredoxin domain-containing protein [Candidatus Muirbacterium halophilum]|nr:thioredoxin domain-containing protein [Candidatus Muirbacterium halophilum]